MVMKEYYGLVSDAFDYYAAKGLGPDPFSMQFNSFFDFLQDCSILDKNCRRQDAEVIFTVANIEEDSKSKESEANQDRYVRAQRLHSVSGPLLITIGISSVLFVGLNCWRFLSVSPM